MNDGLISAVTIGEIHEDFAIENEDCGILGKERTTSNKHHSGLPKCNDKTRDNTRPTGKHLGEEQRIPKGRNDDESKYHIWIIRGSSMGAFN